MAFDEVFFAADWLVGDESFRHHEPVGRDAQAGMVVEPSPATALVVTESEILLQVLVVALDAPALVRTDRPSRPVPLLRQSQRKATFVTQ